MDAFSLGTKNDRVIKTIENKWSKKS